MKSVGAISLRRYLLLGILLPVGLLIIINTVSLYSQALDAVNTAYDRTLLASAKSIGEELDVSGYDAQSDGTTLARKSLLRCRSFIPRPGRTRRRPHVFCMSCAQVGPPLFHLTS